MRHIVKIYFSNGDSLSTEINGTREDVTAYYRIGRVFNLGFHYDRAGNEVEDNLQSVTALEFLVDNSRLQEDLLK